MSETRARKQASVLCRISSCLAEANGLVIEVSSAIVSPSITLDALKNFSGQIRLLYTNISDSLSEFCEFCDDDSQTRFGSQLLQTQATLASLSTAVMSNIVSRSQQLQSSSVNSQV